MRAKSAKRARKSAPVPIRLTKAYKQAEAKYAAIFPPLVVVVEKPSGYRVNFTLPDPRQSFAAAREAGGMTDGEECLPPAPSFPVPSHPLFVVVILNGDGGEQLAKFGVTAVEAVKYAGGFNAGQAATGSYAEVRELDLSSVRTTGRLLGADDVRSQAAKFPQVAGKAVTHEV